MAGVTLYQLVGKADQPQGRNLSPHVWKTKLDLAFFGLDASKIGKTFPGIRSELSEITKNPAVTVPTIEVNGEFTTDSWKIAELLEAEYGTAEKSLFGGPAGKEFAKFIEIWSNTTLANELRPLINSQILNHFDSEAHSWFVQAKLGGDISKITGLQAKLQDPTALADQLALARSRLSVIESLLAYKKAKDEPLWLVGKPTHADFAIFAWYAQSIIHPEVEKGVWRHPDNPLVGEWLDLILESGLVKKEELAF
ncbi:hypothetical protein CI109_101392 [Kwoniella shandongensis]|uniref:Uncharacterized protein n=1 Tax=Kwoniella shandongensis TaxID=1734106 RepID=A0A5M6BUJ6_9TREE|nr:uncharacterized protein CI109_005089 [Kwoniella shandongensis]KAA5526517.1 hypothetical protein CI109_005089 [Kwoniella shandongensis]